MGTLLVQNVSDGIRYGWREANKRRDELIRDIDAIKVMPAETLGDVIAKRTTLDEMHRELNAIRTSLVPVVPDQIAEVPASEVDRFLAHMTDDWAPVEPSAWPPGTVVRKTVKPELRPAALIAQGLLDYKDRLIEFDAAGNRTDPRHKLQQAAAKVA